ncbi:MAG: hypothetical protein WDN46_00935 [Methylocella sp.]
MTLQASKLADTLDAALASWATMNDPRHAATLRAFHRDARPLLLVAPRPHAVLISIASVHGSRADKEEIASAALAAQAGSVEGKAEFQNRPLDACASLLTMARLAAGFEPVDGNNPDNAAALLNYIARVQQCPLFRIDAAYHQQLHYEASDDDLVSKIIGNFTNLDDSDGLKKAQSALVDFVQELKSDAEARADFPILVRTVLRADSDQPDTIIIQTVRIQNIERRSKTPEKSRRTAKCRRSRRRSLEKIGRAIRIAFGTPTMCPSPNGSMTIRPGQTMPHRTRGRVFSREKYTCS